MNTFVIFSGGEIFDYSVVSRNISHYVVICADSGLYHCKKLNIFPHVVIGDFDSYKGEIAPESKVIKSSPEKDDTDTMLCVKNGRFCSFGRIIFCMSEVNKNIRRTFRQT